MDADKAEVIKTFKKLGDISNDIVAAFESGTEKEQEAALGRFVLMMIEFEALK